MLQTLRKFGDNLLGRGSASITVPVMDGAIKPNRALDHAELVATLPDIDDVASDGHTLYTSAGPCLYRLDGAQLTEVRRFDADITALAAGGEALVAVALGGNAVHLLRASDWSEVARLDSLAGRPLTCVNALAFDGKERLLISNGSDRRGPNQWCHDLMEHGHSGRVGRWNFETDTSTEVARGLQYVYGVLATDNGTLFSESWQHRVATHSNGATQRLLAELPGYPSRLASARDGGFWLACFICRTQLVEFVLREDAYRQRMLAEIDPRYWVAPALSSGRSFLEPLQGAGVRQMGVLKPWAPPRSYGLVLHVSAQGRVLSSLHSQVDGHHHGITAVVEFEGWLYAASRGSGRLLRVPLADDAGRESV